METDSLIEIIKSLARDARASSPEIGVVYSEIALNLAKLLTIMEERQYTLGFFGTGEKGRKVRLPA